MNSVPPESAQSTGKVLRTVSIWAVLVVATIALVQLASQRHSTNTDISYSQFAAELEHDNIAAIEITGTRSVEGRFKSTRATGERLAGEFALTLPFDADEAWISSVVRKGVDVRGAEEKQSLAVVVLTFLPYLLIFSLVIFMIKQMKARRGEG